MKDVQIAGMIGYVPAIRNMPQDYQILNRLILWLFSRKSYNTGGGGI